MVASLSIHLFDIGLFVLQANLGIEVSTKTITLIGSAVLLVLLGLSAFFSSSEIAMFSLAKHRIDALVEKGTPGAQTVADLKSDPHRLLLTVLVGNNLVNIAMSSISTVIVGFYFEPSSAVLVSTFGITSIVLLFGESAPKSYAVGNTESWALRIARPLKFAEYAFFSLIVIFDYLTRMVNRVTGGQSAIETSYVTRDEIQEMIETGEREGVFSPPRLSSWGRCRWLVTFVESNRRTRRASLDLVRLCRHS